MLYFSFRFGLRRARFAKLFNVLEFLLFRAFFSYFLVFLFLQTKDQNVNFKTWTTRGKLSFDRSYSFSIAWKRMTVFEKVPIQHVL